MQLLYNIDWAVGRRREHAYLSWNTGGLESVDGHNFLGSGMKHEMSAWYGDILVRKQNSQM